MNDSRFMAREILIHDKVGVSRADWEGYDLLHSLIWEEEGENYGGALIYSTDQTACYFQNSVLQYHRRNITLRNNYRVNVKASQQKHVPH